MRGIPLFAAVAAILAMGEVRAEADELRGTYDRQLEEVSHRAQVTRSGRLAHFTVSRVIRNKAKRVDELTLNVELPSAGVATGLSARIGKRWFKGKLMARKKADALYERLTTKGPIGARGPAVLEWSDARRVTIRTFPVPAKGKVALRYTMTAPLCYYNGWEITTYPYFDDDAIKPRLSARGGKVLTEAKTKALIGTEISEACDGIGVTDEEDVRYLAFRAKRKGLVVRYGRHPAGNKSISRIEIDAPEVFAAKPRNARLVFVIDGSISQGKDRIEAQLDQVRGYMRHLPDARAEVVVYRRYAQRLFGRFVPAASIAAELRKAASRLEPGNGSFLERGLGMAALLLAGSGSGPARIIAFTDSAFRDAFTPAMARASLGRMPRGGLAHLVEVGLGSGAYELERDNEHSLVGVIESTGGMVVSLTGRSDMRSAAVAMRELVVPIRIHGFAVEGKHVTRRIDPESKLDAGVGYRAMWLAKSSPASVKVRGKLWGKRIDRVVRASVTSSAEIPALVFGHEQGTKLGDAVILALASKARVVSPMTSFLARDPRARSSSFDYNAAFGISSTCGCLGGRVSIGTSCGGVPRVRIGQGRGYRYQPEPEAVLRGLLAPGINGCAMTHRVAAFDLRVSVETTGVEIVDVATSGTKNKAFAACVADAAWSLHLPPLFAPQKRYATNISWPVKRR